MSTIKQEKIQNHYDTIADTYDHHYDHHRGRNYHTHISNTMMSSLPVGGNLLDIGCGTGLFVKKYTDRGGQGHRARYQQKDDRAGPEAVPGE